MSSDPVDPVEILRRALQAARSNVEMPTGLRDATVGRPSNWGAKAVHKDGRLRRPLAITGLALLAAGCVTVAIISRGQPTNPHHGTACHATPNTGGDVVAAPVNSNPLLACAEVWRSGALPEPDDPQPGAPVPPLVACIGEGGLVDVFPYLDGCDEIGLETADAELSDANRQLVALQEAVAELNLVECQSVAVMRLALDELLVTYDLDHWTVVGPVNPGGASGCAKGEVDTANQTILIFIL